MKKILACIDASVHAAGVCDAAAWVAGKTGAGVELLHVIQRKDTVAARHDWSGTVGLGAKSALLEELARLDESEGKAALERGKALLAGAESHLREADIAAISQTHRHGGIVETVIEREAAADLVVMGKRGASSDFAVEHLGSKVERVVRASDKPVLVSAKSFTAPKSVLIAYDGGDSAGKALEFAVASGLFDDTALHLVMAGPDDARSREKLNAVSAILVKHKGDATTALLQGPADVAIGDYLMRSGCGMVLMGAYGHSPLRTLLVGSTTTAILRAAEVPVLLFR